MNSDAAAADPPVQPHVLALDDDPAIRAILMEHLAAHDFRISAVVTGTQMLRVLEEQPVDVLLLDLRLPGEDGMSLARKVRETSRIPIIILTGRSDEADRVMGLELAADDYVTKPFSPRELVARIRAVLRRVRAGEPELIRDGTVRAFRFGGWELNMRLHRLISPGRSVVDLTNSEFSLLSAFLSSPGRVLSREQLLERSRLHSLEVYDRSIDVTILRLRRKIEADPANPRFIQTQRGAGYVFTEPVSVLR